MYFYFFLAFLSVATVLSNPTGSQCEFTQEALEKDLLSCVAHNPKLMLEIIEHLKNPESMLNADFICNNQKDLVDVLICMENKLITCLPNGEFISSMLPSKQKWLEGLKFVCDHRTDLIENQCMQSTTQQFLQCYFGKLQGLSQIAAGGLTRDSLQNALCSIVKMEESCIQSFHGTCNQQVVSLMFQALEIFFPMDKCPADNLNLQNPLFNSILVHGQPLQFMPQGEIKYNIVPN
ncbi:hypothetical protein Bpfe_024800 [Biomphalaria pfeifferi]|uniref:Secreted protein n=1 Tax=Biomphalaria pfeifferi TaxID=112525 RepID=A0AAD8F0F6_BIOPF|nr:hypothetical protein Bpfe_024800 [Biomphalaria pfeifferi]